MRTVDKSKTYIQYALDVVSGKILACQSIKLACERFLSWFDKDDRFFDYEDVDLKIKFIYQLKHNSGEYAGKNFELLPWQQWCMAGIFGFKDKLTGYRIVKEAVIFCARKNGKTALAAAIALCCAITDHEAAAEIDCLANNTKQAKLSFKQIDAFVRSIDPKGKIIKRTRDMMRIPKTDTEIQVLSSDSMGQDGYSSHVTILDELAAAKDFGTYNIMKSSMGYRRQPLMIIITTAGFLIGENYPLYSMYVTGKETLKGLKENDNIFYAIYELDDGDDWEDENVWVKSSPSIDITIPRLYLSEQVKLAKNNSALQVGVLTKNFNKFCESQTVWIPSHYIEDASQDVNLDDFKDEECFVGVDLSAVSDMTCTAIMFPPNPERNKWPDKFVFKPFVYLPESTFTDSPNRENYKLWARQGHITITSGNVVDYDYILKDQMILYQNHYIVSLCYDKWNSSQWAIAATEEGLPLEPYSQALGSFNKPTKEFERLIRQGKVVIDNNPAVRWTFANIELKVDWNENCKPIKAGNDQNKKIDPVIAMLQALGGYLDNPRYGDGQVLEV